MVLRKEPMCKCTHIENQHVKRLFGKRMCHYCRCSEYVPIEAPKVSTTLAWLIINMIPLVGILIALYVKHFDTLGQLTGVLGIALALYGLLTAIGKHTKAKKRRIGIEG